MKSFLQLFGVFTLGLLFCFLGGCIKDAGNAPSVSLSDTPVPVISASPSKTAVVSKYYYWAEANGREGVVNERGQTVIPIEYSNVYILDYNDTPAAVFVIPANVKTGEREISDYSGFLFKLDGSALYKGKCYYAYPVCEGLIELSAEKCGVISYKGEEVIPFRYDSIGLYGDYILAVSGDYYDHPGKTVDVNIYDKKGNLQKSGKAKLADTNTDPNLIMVADDTGNKRGLLNFDLEVVAPAVWDALWYEGSGFYKARLGNKWGVINDRGKVVILPKYDDIYCNNDSGALASTVFEARNEDGVYLFDGSGKQLFFSDKFNYIIYKNGMIIVRDQLKMDHYINLEGEDLIPPAGYMYADESGLIKCENSGNTTYYTKDGVKLPLPEAERIETISPERFIFITKGRLYGICGVDGSIIVPAEYDSLYPCGEDIDLIHFSATDKSGKTRDGIIDPDDGRIVFDGFDRISYVGGGLYYADKGMVHGLVNINGVWIWQTSDYQTLMD